MKHIKKFESWNLLKKLKKPLKRCSEFDNNDKYFLEHLDIFSSNFQVFTKDFKVGDTIYWLGHDNVHGFMNGETLIADQEAVDKKDELSFGKKVCDCTK